MITRQQKSGIVRWLIILNLFMLGCSSAYSNQTISPSTDSSSLTKLVRVTESLDPAFASSEGPYDVIPDLFEGLTTFDQSGDIVAGQAESWFISEDLKSYTFTLRKGLKWSDGTPLTAKNFVAGVHHVVDPDYQVFEESKPTYLLNPIKNANEIVRGEKPVDQLGVTALDDHTLRFTLEYPVAYFLSLLTNPAYFPAPTHLDTEHAEDWTSTGNIVSNGPYKIVNWQKNDYLEAVTNPHYRINLEEIDIKKIKFDFTENIKKSSVSFLHKKTDIISYPEGVIEIDGDFITEKNIKIVPLASTMFIQVNFKSKELQNVQVRKALNYSLDRNEIQKRVVDSVKKPIEISSRSPAYAFAPASRTSGWKPLAPAWVEEKTMQERISEARSLMLEAGYSRSNPLKLEFLIEDHQSSSQIIAAFQQHWSKIWVELKPNYVKGMNNVLAESIKGKFDLKLFSWHADFDDPYGFYELLKSDAEFNIGDYSSPSYDELLSELIHVSDVGERAVIYKKLENIIQEEVAAISFQSSNRHYVLQDYIETPTPGFMGTFLTRFIQKK